MDFQLQRTGVCFLFVAMTSSLGIAELSADTNAILFDMPAASVAIDTSRPGEAREVTLDLALSSLVSGSAEDLVKGAPPIDHLLVRCRLRDRLPVTDYSPKTELQTDYAGPISVTEKDERSDSLGLNVDAAAHPFGGAHFGADDSRKQSDSTQFQRQAPMQAVIASGTVDRGRGVYFKFRWTTQQVLEGEKRFRISFSVPETWRGGLLDITVTANSIDRSLFSSPKLRQVARSEFVLAAYQEHDAEAAEIALRLAHLDQKLSAYAKDHPKQGSNGFSEFWRRLFHSPRSERGEQSWYHGVTKSRLDPYHDRKIQSLPMPVRVAVLGYTNAARELTELNDAG